MATMPMNQRRWLPAAFSHRAIIAITVAVFLMASVLTVYFCPQSTKAVVEQRVPIPVQNAQEKGAVCFEETTPQYHLDQGSSAGADSWMLHLEVAPPFIFLLILVFQFLLFPFDFLGGAWCGPVESCLERSQTWQGSCLYMDPQGFDGIVSAVLSENPDYPSNSGDVEEVEKIGSSFGSWMLNNGCPAEWPKIVF